MTFKENYHIYIIALVSSVLLSYGISEWIPFVKGVCIIIPLLLTTAYLYIVKSGPDVESQRIIQDLENILAEQTDILKEREDILDEYEKVFDTQLVKLPCVCGGNTFEGLFSSNVENVVTCDKCRNKYRVDISYNSVLLSEPMDGNSKNFEQLIANQ